MFDLVISSLSANHRLYNLEKKCVFSCHGDVKYVTVRVTMRKFYIVPLKTDE